MGKSKKATADAGKNLETKQKEGSAATQPPAKAKKASKASEAAAAAAAVTNAAAADSLPSKKRAAKDEIDAIFASSKKAAAAEPKVEEQLNPELQQLAAEVGAARQAAQVCATIMRGALLHRQRSNCLVGPPRRINQRKQWPS